MAASTKKPSSMAAQEDKWRAESDARTLMEAQKIQQDTARRRAAMSHVKQEMKAAHAVVHRSGGSRPTASKKR